MSGLTSPNLPKCNDKLQTNPKLNLGMDEHAGKVTHTSNTVEFKPLPVETYREPGSASCRLNCPLQAIHVGYRSRKFVCLSFTCAADKSTQLPPPNQICETGRSW